MMETNESFESNGEYTDSKNVFPSTHKAPSQYSVSFYGGIGYGMSPARIQRAQLTYDPEPNRKKVRSEEEYFRDDYDDSISLKTDTLDMERISRKKRFELVNKNKSQKGNSESEPKTQNSTSISKRNFVKSKTIQSIVRNKPPTPISQVRSQSSASARDTRSVSKKDDVAEVSKKETPRKRLPVEKALNESMRKKQEREEIKKRLELLKKNTKDILQKSLKNKSARSVTKNPENPRKRNQALTHVKPSSNLNVNAKSNTTERGVKNNIDVLENVKTQEENDPNKTAFRESPHVAEVNSKSNKYSKKPSIDNKRKSSCEKIDDSNIMSSIPEKLNVNSVSVSSKKIVASPTKVKKNNYSHRSMSDLQNSSINNRSNCLHIENRIKRHSTACELENVSTKSCHSPEGDYNHRGLANRNGKRIGLLRKPDTRDHSYSEIKDLNIDNQSLVKEMLSISNKVHTKQKCLPLTTQSEGVEAINSNPISEISKIKESKVTFDSKVTEIENRPFNNEQEPRETESTKKPNINSDLSQKCNQLEEPSKLPQTIFSETKVNVPNDTANGKNVYTNETNDPSQLAFWLKPSAVHVFPYNFIVAVRRKLEAFAHTVDNTSLPVETKCAETSTRSLNINISDKQQLNQKRTKHNSTEVSDSGQRRDYKSNTQNINKNLEQFFNSKAASHLETSSNSTLLTELQSHTTLSNNFEKPKSPRKPLCSLSNLNKDSKETQSENEDSTTISSSVFNSPEKRKERLNYYVKSKSVSPLSTEKINKLKLKASVNENSETCLHTNSSLHGRRNQPNVDVNQFLEDFNRSLSQAIEVNEILKTSLENSKQNSPASSSRYSSADGKVYSNDFEDSTKHSNAIQTKPRTMELEKSVRKINGQAIHNEPHFDLGLKSNSSCIQPDDDDDDDEYDNDEEGFEEEVEETNKSISVSRISSNKTKTLDNTNLLPCETQLNLIDKLKEQFKQNLMNSKKSRLEENELKGSQNEALETSQSKAENSMLEFEKHLKSIKEVKSKLKETIQKAQMNFSEFLDSEQKSNSSNKRKYTKCDEIPRVDNFYEQVSNRTSQSVSYKELNSDEKDIKAISEGSSSERLHNQLSNKSISEDLQEWHGSPTNSNTALPITTSADSQKRQFIQSHINWSRGNFPESDTSQRNEALFENDVSLNRENEKTRDSLRSEGESKSDSKMPLNQSDFELSCLSSRSSSVSESFINYSCVGMYEKLIRNEVSKSEYLFALLKMRERALLDRTKGQLAWLQVQKERYKSKGLLLHINEIRRKQRSIIAKMEEEREEIKKLLGRNSKDSFSNDCNSIERSAVKSTSLRKDSSSNNSQVSLVSCKQPLVLVAPPHLPKYKSLRQIKSASSKNVSLEKSQRASPIVRANYDLVSSKPLEDLLLKREADLKERRKHVEHLLLWHQKLDEEEANLQQLEKRLYDSSAMILCIEAKEQKPSNHPKPLHISSQTNLQSICSDRSSRSHKMDRRLHDIDKTLKELKHISGTTTSSKLEANGNIIVEPTKEYVRTSGSKLNKLWRRLTAQQIEKFEPNRRYKLCKSDLERIYEEAKIAVIKEFNQNELLINESLLDGSSPNNESEYSPSVSRRSEHSSQTKSTAQVPPVVPELNLTSSTNTLSERDGALTHTFDVSPAPQDTYSPFAAEQDYQTSLHGRVVDFDDASIPDKSGNFVWPMSNEKELDVDDRLKRNTDKFLSLTCRSEANKSNLSRSLSDPSLNNIFKTTNSLHSSLLGLKSSANRLNIQYTLANGSGSSQVPISSSIGGISTSIKSSSSNFSQSSCPKSSQSNNNPVTTSLSSDEALVSETNISRPSVICSTNLVNNNMHSSSEEMSLEPEQSTTTSSINYEKSDSLRELSDASENKEREISEKLSQISEALSHLESNNVDYPTKKSTQSASSSSIESLADDLTEPIMESSVCIINKSSQNEKTPQTQSSKEPNTFSDKTMVSEPTDANVFIDISNLKKPNQDYGDVIKSPSKVHSIISSKHSTLTKQTLDDIEFDSDVESTNDISNIEDLSLPHFNSSAEATSEDSRILDQSLKSNENVEMTLEKATSAADTAASKQQDAAKASNMLAPIYAPGEKDCVLPSSPVRANDKTHPICSNEDGDSSVSANLNLETLKEVDYDKLAPQYIIDNEKMKQYANIKSIPYMYVREVPNKPPPPYVPPAHGSPMTTIFPSEERIKDITFRRSHELYCDLTKTEYKSESGEKLVSVLSEKITNIYERIVLDICREYLEENQAIIETGDPKKYYNRLALFNPPDRLRCIQERIYSEVRRALAMDKGSSNKRSQNYSIYGVRAKTDHIGKIIIQETFDEDELWCNFHREEGEVISLILDEMINNEVASIVEEMMQNPTTYFESQNKIDDAKTALNNLNNNCLDEDNWNENHENDLNETRFRESRCIETQIVSFATYTTEPDSYLCEGKLEDSHVGYSKITFNNY